jgi:transcriptional regulator with XRE-family HTH domain
MTNPLAMRLKEVRQARGLSLRRMQHALENRGYEVSHDSIRHYEQGTRTIPVDYVRMVCIALDVDAAWLMFGDRAREIGSDEHNGVRAAPPAGQAEALRQIPDEMSAPFSRMEQVQAAWAQYVDGFPTRSAVRPVIADSWSRSQSHGVEPRPRPVQFRRLPAEALERRLAAQTELVSVARPHLRWVSRQLAAVEHVIYLTDAEGIVLAAEANKPELVERWGLSPGYDWSEATMGTNGAGTALRTGRVSAVLGPEHFVEAFHDAVCLAAPIRGEGGVILGALDLSMLLEHADPANMMLVVYAAAAIQSELAARDGPGTST